MSRKTMIAILSTVAVSVGVLVLYARWEAFSRAVAGLPQVPAV